MPAQPKHCVRQSTGPEFKRNALIALDFLSTDDPATGWRTVDQERVDYLIHEFKTGNFGITVTCGVTILEKEDSAGKKLIDDGVSTVLALKACQAYFAGEPGELKPSIPLDNIFQFGLEVKVIAYADDDDRESRECWNVARHDEESFTVRWSSVSQKVNSAMTYYRRHGDWTATKNSMLTFYGNGKEQTIGRWVRAAKGLDTATLETLKQFPKIKGSYIWDNYYLITSTTRSRDKLSPPFAADALAILAEHGDELTAAAFTNKVCKPMRVLEIWHTLMCKRYGSVATLSPALSRLMTHLRSWGGLASVRRCIDGGVVLQDGAGIPECALLAAEFDKCKAGGLPPPQKIPTDADRKAEEEAAKKAAQEAEIQAKEKADEAEREAKEKERAIEEATRAAEADLLLMTADAPPGVSAGGSVVIPREIVAATNAESRLKKVGFYNTPEGLLGSLRKLTSPLPRFVCLVEAPTTKTASFGHLMDTVADVWGALKAANGGEPLQKFRLVILVGSRFELIVKATEKVKANPDWSAIVVQLQRRDRQSDRSRPSYAVVAAPASDLTATEPTVVTLPRQTTSQTSKFALNLRCTEAECCWRPEQLRATANNLAAENGAFEIPPEDQVNLMEIMMSDLAEEEEEVAGQDDDELVTDTADSLKRDAICDLWPYARTPEYYTEMLTMLGSGVKASACIILSTTAHPSHWLASEKMGLDTWVLTRRWSEHSFGHGQQLGRELLIKEELIAMPAVADNSGESSATPECIQAAVERIADGQLIEAYDMVQGDGWNEGINRAVPAQIMIPGSQGLVRKEAEQFSLRVTNANAQTGRGLETVVARRDGEKVCTASALFFDDWNTLLATVRANPRFSDRVVHISGVKRGGKEISVWAVLLGIAQFAQHFAGIRARHNAVLEFCPAEGFNNGSLRIVASTRTGVGISAGAPILLNYGASFNFDAAREQAGNHDSYLGALDQLFAQQRNRLPEELRYHPPLLHLSASSLFET